MQLFDDSIGQPYTEDMLKLTSCGAGKMLAVGVDGKLYPCMRYCSYSLNHQDEYVIGHVNTGIDYDKFVHLKLRHLSYKVMKNA